MIEWSDDCFACLCNLPHGLEEHDEALVKAQETLAYRRETLKRCETPQEAREALAMTRYASNDRR